MCVCVCVCVRLCVCLGGGGGGERGGGFKRQGPIYLGTDNPSCHPKAVFEKIHLHSFFVFYIYDIIFK